MLTVSTTVTGNSTVINAPTAGLIRVLGYQITSSGNPGRVTLKSSATVKAGISNFSASGGGLGLAPSDLGYFECDAITALTISQVTTGVVVDVSIQYCLIGNVN